MLQNCAKDTVISAVSTQYKYSRVDHLIMNTAGSLLPGRVEIPCPLQSNMSSQRAQHTLGFLVAGNLALGFFATAVPSAATLGAAFFLGVFGFLALGFTTFFFFCTSVWRDAGQTLW